MHFILMAFILFNTLHYKIYTCPEEYPLMFSQATQRGILHPLSSAEQRETLHSVLNYRLKLVWYQSDTAIELFRRSQNLLSRYQSVLLPKSIVQEAMTVLSEAGNVSCFKLFSL